MVLLYYWYKSRLNLNKSFKEFVIKYKCNNLNKHCINNKSVCDFFIRYEYLEEDISTHCKNLKINSCNISLLPKYKSTYRKSQKHWSEYYDDETKENVYNKYKKEIELFCYDK